MKRSAVLLATLTLGLAPGAFAASLALTGDGLVVDAGAMGSFTLSYPQLLSETGDTGLKPAEVRPTGRQALLRYAAGAEVTMAVADDGTVSLEYRNLPAAIRKIRMDMLIDFSFSEGGKWQIGGADPQPFPRVQPPRPFLFQGNETVLRLIKFEGRQLTFQVPQYSYQQLQDNREWNWKVFGWMFVAPLDAGRSPQTLRITEGAAAGGVERVIVVDRFGQDAALAFPGKVTSEQELKQDVERDRAYYDSLQPPSLDPFGGLPGSGQELGLQRTGFFHTQQAAGRWLLVDPAGNAVFHLGICGFQPSDDYTYIKGREQIYEWLPTYEGPYRTAFHPDGYWSRDALSFYLTNVIRKYGKPYDPEEWMARIIQRVRKWGFNATGAFSGITEAHRQAGFPYVGHLPLGQWDLGGEIPGLRGFFDPFDPAAVAKMEDLFSRSVAPRAEDPLLIGYFLANEQAFEDIPRAVPALRATQPAKQELVKFLQGKYGEVAALNRAWGLQAGSFDALRDAGLPVTTRQANDDMQAFTDLFITRYYQVICDAFHRCDHHHLLLGNRWQPGTANDERLCAIAGRFMDVISLNYYTYGVDVAFLDRLDRWCQGKPMMLSEFYWASPSDTGLPGGKEVRSQRERGLAYRNYVEQSARLPYIIGIEWFTLLDQARSGRFFERYTGEKANTGLLSVADRPYRDCLAEMMRANYDIYSVLLGRRAPYVFDDPRFTGTGQAARTLQIPRAPGAIKLDGTRAGWPGTPPERLGPDRLVEGANAAGLEAVFRLCWDDDNLYLLVEVTDATPMRNAHQGDSIWSGDGVEVFLGHEQPDRPGPLLFSDRQVLLSAGLVDGKPQWFYAHAPRQYDCGLKVIPKVDGKGYVLEAAIPLAALDLRPTEGQRILFDLALDNSDDGLSRTCQLMWNGIARNSGDRTHWAHATLTR